MFVMRYVILEHDHPFLHWDFMIEENGVLTTWRMPLALSAQAAQFEAQGIGDHRLAYLDYEGPVSGGRGKVARWDEGTYQTMAGDGIDRRLLRLRGRRCSGTILLEKRDQVAWTFTYSPEASDPTSTNPRPGSSQA